MNQVFLETFFIDCCKTFLYNKKISDTIYDARNAKLRNVNLYRQKLRLALIIAHLKNIIYPDRV